MGIFTRSAVASAAREDAPASSVEPQATLGDLSIRELHDLNHGVPAMSVGAYARAYSLITGVPATMPLRPFKDGVRQPARLLLDQPEPDRPYWTTMQALVSDLFQYDRAYWRVLLTDGEGFPTKVRLLPAAEVSDDADTAWIEHKNTRLGLSDPTTPGSSAGRVIKFSGLHGGQGILVRAANAIATALAQEDAVKRYAAEPLPSMVLKNKGAELPPDKVKKLLDSWAESRRQRATAFLNAVVDAEAVGWSASELQLVEGRQSSAVQIARHCNIDPMWVGATVPGSSMTYTNRVDARRDLIDFTLSQFMAPIEQRLSMHDVTPRGTIARFWTGVFTRSNIAERAQIAVELVDKGIWTVEQAAAFIDDTPGEDA